MKFFNHLLQISEPFDIFLFDAYGVFNFGTHVSQSTLEIMASLVAAQKRVIIVSNATFLNQDAIIRYAKKSLVLGVHYHDVMTSGQFAYEAIQKQELPVDGKKVYIFGTANFQKPQIKMPAIFSNSAYVLAENPHEADFAYCGIPQIDGQDRTEIEDFLPALQELKAANLTLVCANPDLRAFENGSFVVRQGLICQKYQSLGGKVIIYGKPDAKIYSRVFSTLGDIDKNRILMIGDTLGTDILGANRAGIKSCLLIEGGITEYNMQTQGLEINQQTLQWFIQQQGAVPDYICQRVPEKPL